MKKENRAAYGVTQAFTSGDDLTFKSTTSVLKAAIARKRELAKQSWKPFVFVFPTIIVDSLLFECYLDDSGEVAIENIEDKKIEGQTYTFHTVWGKRDIH